MWCNPGVPAGNFWFIFPVMGLVFMIVMMFVVFHFSRRTGMCGFAKGREPKNIQKEIQDLRTEVETLKREIKEGIL